MMDLVRAGKVRHVGISNVTLDEFERARRTGADRLGAEPVQPRPP